MVRPPKVLLSAESEFDIVFLTILKIPAKISHFRKMADKMADF